MNINHPEIGIKTEFMFLLIYVIIMKSKWLQLVLSLKQYMQLHFFWSEPFKKYIKGKL